jgi:MFS family permease
MLQMLWYGIGTQTWMMWGAGILAAVASITYPAISAFVSIHSTPDQQGVVQGMVTGMRGLCNGLGPAMFGVIFYLFNVDLNDDLKHVNSKLNYNDMKLTLSNSSEAVQLHNHNANELMMDHDNNFITQFMPGPPFVFGSMMVVVAILVAVFIKEENHPDAKRTSIVGEMKSISLFSFYFSFCVSRLTNLFRPSTFDSHGSSVQFDLPMKYFLFTETDNDRLNAYDNDVTFDMMMESRQY